MARSWVSSYAWNRGIISPLGLARFDLKRYALSAQVMVNWMARTLGSMMLRPGLAFVDSIYNNLQAVHIPFIKEIADTAIVELTNNLMRVRINEVILTRVAVGTTITNPTFTSDLNGWTQGDDAGGLSQWVAGPYMSLSGNGTARGLRYQTVAVASGDVGKEHALRIVVQKGYVNLRVGTSQGDDSYINSTTLAPGTHSLALVPTGNFVIQVYSATVYATLVSEINIEPSGQVTLPTPWPTSMLKQVRWDQSEDVVFCTSDGTVPQQRIERRGDGVSYGRSWSVVPYYVDDGPMQNQNIDTTIILSASSLTGDITLSSNIPFFKAGHVGGLFSLQSQLGQEAEGVVAGNSQFIGNVEVTGVGVGRNLTINISGTWEGTIALQYSVGDPGAWVTINNWTSNQDNIVFNDGFDNQIIYYQIGFVPQAYTSGSATVSLSFAVPDTTAGIVRVDSFNSSTEVNAHVLTPLSGISSLPGVEASGFINFAVNPSNGDTIKLNGVTWTFVTSGATTAQTNIKSTLALTMVQLASDLTASVNASLTVATYAGSNTAIDITYGTIGAAGNSYTLQAGTLNGTPSGPTLSGGVGATIGVGTTLWAEGIWNGINGYPTDVKFYEGRLWWFGQGYVMGSVSDAYASFDNTVVGDSGPIIRTLPFANMVWALPLQRLLIGLDICEYSIQSDALNDPLTPTNFNSKSPSTRGGAQVAAVKVDTQGLFVQRGDPTGGNDSGTRLIQMSFNGIYAVIDYTGLDLSEFCPEVVAIGINRICVQRKIDTRVHCVLNDGTVAILLYDPVENEKCWMTMSFPNGFVEDAFVMPGVVAGGVEDTVYYSVRRTINGQTVRYLERYALESECTGLPMAKCVDSHFVYAGPAVTTITGLGHLEGQQISVWGWNTITPYTVTMPDGTTQQPGQDLGLYTVSGGQITGLTSSVTNAVGGIPYTAQFQSVKLIQTLQGKDTISDLKSIDRLGVIVANMHCQGLQYGRNFNDLDNMPQNEQGYDIDLNTVWPAAEMEHFTFPGTWDPDSRLCLQAASPRPVTLLASRIGITAS